MHQISMTIDYDEKLTKKKKKGKKQKGKQKTKINDVIVIHTFHSVKLTELVKLYKL